jgi:MFS transporter, DHA2 family, multidrug resistance protein
MAWIPSPCVLPGSGLATGSVSWRAAACALSLILGLGLYGSVYVLPVYLEQIQGYDALEIGEVVMWLGVPQLFILPFVPFLMRRIYPRLLIAVGLVLFAASAFMNTHMKHDTAGPRLRWAMLVRALGQPLIMIPLTSLATAGLKASQTATASSLFNMVRNLGGSIGTALLQTFTEAREQYHFSIIAERLTQNGLLVQERIRDLTQSFLPTANGIDEAPAMAVATIRDTVRRDAFIMAYSDCFFLTGLALVFSLAAVAFLQRPVPGAPPAER